MAFKTVSAGFSTRNPNTNQFQGISELKPFIFNTDFVSTASAVKHPLLNPGDTVWEKDLVKVTMSNNTDFFVDMSVEEFFSFIG
jgi:hypothetical protein